MPAVKPAIVSVEDPQAYEDAHVHAIYDQIAPHFSSTRYKPWPIIAAFLSSLPVGWVGVDLGTGNGKYLPEGPGNIWTIGLDRSTNLLTLAKRAGDVVREVVLGDVLDNPWRVGALDYAISVATIHHLATPHRRKAAVKRLIQSISPSHGRALIYVWGIEQDELSKRSIPTSTGRDLEQEVRNPSVKGQDVFVPWVLTNLAASRPKTQEAKKFKDGANTHGVDEASIVFNRYYHMFAKGELAELVTEAAAEMGLVVGDPEEGNNLYGQVAHGLRIVAEGWERSNYYVELHLWERLR